MSLLFLLWAETLRFIKRRGGRLAGQCLARIAAKRERQRLEETWRRHKLRKEGAQGANV